MRDETYESWSFAYQEPRLTWVNQLGLSRLQSKSNHPQNTKGLQHIQLGKWLSDTHGERDNEKEPGNPQQHVLAVGPLNSIPYFNPDMLESWSPEADNEKVERAGPGVILPKKEWDDSIDATRRGVGLTRTAALGMVGPSVGLLDIGEMEDSYMFRVSLPGVAANERLFRCNIKPDGNVFIKGVSTTGEETVYRNSQLFKMKSQNLCPPGPFSISFELPGPVNDQQISTSFENGVFEAMVKKR